MSEEIKEEDAYKIFRQLEERKKRANPYTFYDKDELIDEILKQEDEIEDLQQKVEQLESIRKDAIEYLESEENIIDRFWKHDFRKYPDYNPFEAKDEEEVRCVELYGYDDLLNILNKGSEE